MQNELEQLKSEWDAKLASATWSGEIMFDRKGTDESQLEAMMGELRQKQHLLSELES